MYLLGIKTVEVVDCDSDIEAIEDTKVVDLSEGIPIYIILNRTRITEK